jgi:hypothetical protein
MSKTVIEFLKSTSSGPHIKYGGTSFTCSGSPKSYEYKYGAGSLCHLWHSAKTGGVLSGGTAVDHPQIDTLISEADCAAVINDACTQVWSGRGRFAESNLYESLAEWKKTVAMIRSLYDDIVKLATSLLWYNDSANKRRLRNIAVGDAKRADEFWLTWRYGIVPLAMQIEDLIEAQFRESGKKRRETTREKVSAFASASETKTLTWGSAVMTFRASTTESFKVRAMSLDEGYITMADTHGMSVKNLLTVPWELLKLSFVVDWFANVGDYLGASVPSFGLDQLGSCYVRERRQVITITPVSTVGAGGYTVVQPLTGEIQVARTYTSRVTPLEPPKLLLRQNFGFYKNGAVKWNRVLDASALISVFLSSMVASLLLKKQKARSRK